MDSATVADTIDRDAPVLTRENGYGPDSVRALGAGRLGDHAHSTNAEKIGQPTNVELFAGAGGLALGCHQAGFKSLATLEWDRWACDTIRENKAAGHPLVSDWNIVEGDVRAFDWSTLESEVDLVSGGPPCQPFSAGGKHRASDDPRDMFPATAEVLSTLQPRAFVVENVRGLTRPAFADYYEYIQRRLAAPGVRAETEEDWFDHLTRLRTNADLGGLTYNVVPTLVNAADYGVPQQRHRVFMVGFRSDVNTHWTFPMQTHSQQALLHAQWITGDYWDEHEVSRNARVGRPSERVVNRLAESGPGRLARWRTVRDALKGLPEPTTVERNGYPNHILQPGARSYSGHTGSPLDMPAKALKAGGHGVPGGENMMRFPSGAVRYFTVRESARLQTFPDDYRLHGSWGEAMRQLGNAVPVLLARVVVASVHNALTSLDIEGEA